MRRIRLPAQPVFDSVRAKLLFEADVFWARTSIGNEVLKLWLEDISNLQKLSKTRYCGIEAAVIHIDDQMLLAQQCIGSLGIVLLEARKTHSPEDYLRLAEPILLEIQQREQEVLEYLSRDLEHPVAS